MRLDPVVRPRPGGCLRYLAYGSNLHPARLRDRVPSARSVGILALGGWALRFHKVGLDGSAKCNVVQTGREDDRVHCALYDIDAREKALLDRFEGPRYRETALQTARFGEVFFYVALNAFVDDTMQPYSWYRDLVLAGAEYHAFPPEYLEGLRRTACLPDPDRERHALNVGVLATADALRGNAR